MSPTHGAQAIDVPQREGIKETLESIIVALILAFVFRAFVVEAFVIPTGSMAPTLYGAHGTIICEDCGVEFGYGVRDLADRRRGLSVRRKSKAVCPNCNHANTNLKVSDENLKAEKGDRILVLKWPLAIGSDLLGPARWDVVVFKDPSDGKTNFIKRLVGFPGEVLQIIDGDVYTVPLEDLSEHALSELDQLRHEKYELREGIRSGRLRAVPAEVLSELDEKLKITRKTPAAQESLWFTVYDHDHAPRTLDAGQPRWLAGAGDESGWDASTRWVRFADRGLASDYIELVGKQARATSSYNIHRGRAPVVSDLRVRFVLAPAGRDGACRVQLEKLGRTFEAQINMDGTVRLSERRDGSLPDGFVMAERKLPPFEVGKLVAISVENIDYRLALRVGGEEVLTSSDDPDSQAYYGANLKRLRGGRAESPAPPRIYGDDGDFELTHLVVERDSYYYHATNHRALSLPWAPRGGWASAESPMLLRGHEFFMLGDNTAASKDSRLWDLAAAHLRARGEAFQLGTVPRDQLIGKAFFVYWPSGHRLSWLPSLGSWHWPIVPDVGRMRWIR